MTTSLFVNEIRIPLSSVTQLDVLQCSTNMLSSRHKKAIEHSLIEKD